MPLVNKQQGVIRKSD